MGKKVKTGKSRKDKFYKLAKETGYRARSSFKLLQLNRKYEFLQKSRVCIDLCAAPGGWLQVASQHMPVSSVIVGVDLVPIRPIPNCTTLTEDITTEKCRQALRKSLQTWKADVVLNDGAPNVGKNWLFDAYAQAELTLHALKLAAEFLRKGGWFVTKVFRSKDYHALMWVFNQLFKKVHATKPQASRNESAEIFVVCQSFAAPDKLDPKFFDPKHVFKDVKQDVVPQTIDLHRPEKVKKKAEGYADEDYTLHHPVSDAEFIQANNHLEMLAMCSQINLETDAIAKHPSTTTEIKECCKDIKVLGKTEIRSLITWRKKMKPVLEEYLKTQAEANVEDDSESEAEAEEEAMDVADVEDGESGAEGEGSGADEEEKIKDQLEQLQQEESKDAKRKARRVAKEKRKLRDKMALNMILPGDVIEQTEDIALFDLKKIKSKQQLTNVEGDEMAELSDSDHEVGTLPKHVNYSRHDKDADDWTSSEDENEASEDESESESDESDSDSSDDDGVESLEIEMESDNDDDVVSLDESEEEESSNEKSAANPLVVAMETKEAKAARRTDMWFGKDAFSGLEHERDEDAEIEQMSQQYQRKGGVIIGEKRKKAEESEDEESDSGLEDFLETEEILSKTAKRKLKKDQSKNAQDKSKDSGDNKDKNKKAKGIEEEAGDSGLEPKIDDESDSSSESDSDSDEETYRAMSGEGHLTSMKEVRRQRKQAALNKAHKDGFEIVSAEEAPRKIRKLDPMGLAIGEEMVKSNKRRREIIDDSFNRYTFNDDNLPDWFSADEKKHMKRNMPVTKEQVALYKERLKQIDAAPIKKIAEAKARKKKKVPTATLR